MAAANGFGGTRRRRAVPDDCRAGPPDVLGIGLSDIASAGFIYLAALIVMSARGRGESVDAAGAGASAIGFYTRLNNCRWLAGPVSRSRPIARLVAPVVGRRVS